MSDLILASASPRRRELLERLGFSLQIEPAEIDEGGLPGEEAIPFARRLSAAKTGAVATRFPARWVLGADTVVELEGEIFGKAADREAAGAALRRLLGRTHRVVTSFAIRGPAGFRAQREVVTEVAMREAPEGEIAAYLECGEWRGKAGSYAIQGIAAAFVRAVRGSVTNVIGLPVAEAIEELSAAGGPRPDYRRGRPA